MAYWIQEYHAPGTLRPDHKMFNADYVADLANMPTKTDYGVYQENDAKAYEPVKAGDQVLFLDTCDVYEMGEETGWNKLA